MKEEKVFYIKSIDSAFNKIIEENFLISGKISPFGYKLHREHEMDRTRRETSQVILLSEHYTEQIKDTGNFRREDLSHL